MQIQLKKIFRLYLAKFVKAKATTGLPYAGLVLYYTMVYLLVFRWLRPARYVGELLEKLFGTNYSVNWILAAVYRQMSNFEDECKALMRIVPANRHDINLLHRAGETAAYAGDVDSLEMLRDIAEQESPSFLSYLNGLLAYLNGQANYHAHFKESVKAFFNLERIGLPDASGNSLSILMKRAIKSGQDIPEFVRMAYNIREPESIDELLIADRPPRNLLSLPSVLDGTSASDHGLNDPIILISCSDCYLNVFADYYIRIFRRKNQNIIHFHVLTDDAEATLNYFATLIKKHSNVCYSIEAISGKSQAYITLARFLICRDLMKHYNRDVLISDIDVHFDFDLSLICRKLRSKDFDFGLFDMGYSVPWGKFGVGCSYFRAGNHASDVYLDLLSRHLTSLYSDGGFFGMDMSGASLIYEYMQARGQYCRMFNLYTVIDFKRLVSVPKQLQRGKIKCKFGDGGPQ